MHESWCPNHAAAQPKPRRRLEKELSKQKCVCVDTKNHTITDINQTFFHSKKPPVSSTYILGILTLPGSRELVTLPTLFTERPSMASHNHRFRRRLRVSPTCFPLFLSLFCLYLSKESSNGIH
ncbi:unnamed protein product [Brassica oleracea]